MGTFIKILLSLLSFFILAVLVFFTFSPPSIQQPESTFSEESFLGKFSLNITQTGAVKQKISEISFSSSGAILGENLSLFDDIYFIQGGQYSYLGSGAQNTLNLGEGEFIMNLKDPYKKTILLGSDFSITPHGIGKIGVKITDSKHTIFSIDSIIDVRLFDQNTKKTITSLTLFPHQYFSFNPQETKFVQNADHLRLKSIFDLGYIATPLYEKGGSLFLSVSTLGFSKSFLEGVGTYNFFKEKNYHTYLKNLRADVSFYDIPGIAYIQKYTYLFLNDSKKYIYHKNKAVETLDKMLKISDEKEYLPLEKSFLEAMNDMKKIQGFESDGSITLLINDTLKMLLFVSDDTFLESKIAYIRLWGKLNHKQDDIINQRHNFLAHNLYAFYDKGNISGFYTRLVLFVNQYFKVLNISPEDKNSIKSVPPELYNDLDYFAFFLESVLVSNLIGTREDIQDIIDIMNKYIFLNTLLYSQGDSTLKTTGLYVNLELLRSVSRYLGTNYFEGERNEKKLLQKKYGINDVGHIKGLETNVNLVKNFYNDNSKFLSETESRDSELKLHYENIFKDYDEYFLALLDYDNYELNFDPVSRVLKDKLTLLNTSETQNTSLSELSLRTYLVQFQALDMQEAIVEIKDDTYYQVTQAYIDGKKIDFKVYPKSGFELTDIYINDQIKRESYKLDNIKDDWEAKQLESSGEGDEYDFRKFFLLKFSPQGQVVQPVEIIEDPKIVTYCPEESKTIRAFKAQIFDKQGPFIPLKGLIDITYNNLCVTGEDSNFNITITGALVTFSDESRLKGDMHAHYIIEQNISKIEDVKIKFFQDYDTNKTTFRWNGSPLIVRGFISLSEIKEHLEILGKIFPHVSVIADSLYSRNDISSIELNYFVVRKRVVIKFDFKGKKANIGLDSSGVDSFIYNNKSILSKTTPASDVIKIFDTLQ